MVIALLSSALVVLASQAVLAGTYTVKPGDTLWRIAQSHNVSVEALQAANNLGESGVVIVGQVLTVPGASATTAPATPPSSPRPTPPAAGAGTGKQHVVQAGETLYSIATQYRTTVASLRQLNDLGEDAVLVTGRTLRVPTAGQPVPSTPVTPPGPGAVWHEVQRGDTLSSISRRYSVSLTQLESWNQISSEAPLIAGNRLRVGGGEGTASAAVPPATPSVAAPPVGDRSHTVVRGDTLSSIARAHNVRVAELAAVNQIPVDSMVRIGQILQLPANASAPAPPADVADTTLPPGAPVPPGDTPAVATTSPVEPTAPPEPTQPDQPSTTEGVPSQPEVAAQESPQPPPAIADDTEHGATTDTLDDFFSYEIQPEQSLTEVAKIFFTTEAELLRINPRIQTADQARPGERILVPGEGLKKRFASQF